LPAVRPIGARCDRCLDAVPIALTACASLRLTICATTISDEA